MSLHRGSHPGTHRLRAPAACATLLLALLTTGCHHKTQVSRNYPPPPVYGGSRAPVPRRPVMPREPVDDNLVPSGRVASSMTGLASWYGPPYANRQAANGQIYDQNAMTAAHRTLPLGTVIRVTNLTTEQAATVRITDRGPFVHGRVLDLSLAAAKEIGLYRMGVAEVKIDILQERQGASVSAGKWCVQVGAFLDSRNAARLQADLQRRYADTARVIQFQGPTGYWVRVNPVGADRVQARQIAQAIRTAEPDALPYLVRLD